jgi:membrane protein
MARRCAVITAILFIAGKSVIGWYIGSSAAASTYGAAGGLIVLNLPNLSHEC